MAKKQKPEDLLAGLADTLEEGQTTETARPTLTTEQALLERYAGLDAVMKLVKPAHAEAGDEFKAHSWAQFTDKWFTDKACPGNPRVEVKEGGKVQHTGLFQVKAAFKVQHVEGIESARGAVTQALVNAGFEPEKADEIFDANVEVKVDTVMRPLNELVHGKWVSGKGGKQFVEATAEEKAAAEKILKYLAGKPAAKLTPAEVALVMTKQTSYVVKSGFMDRAHTYCEDATQLRALLTVIKPTLAVSGVKYAKTAAERERLEMLRQVFGDLIESE
jgi:hypothetical protein